MGKKLKIPNELIEANGRVYWNRDSLGFTAIEKCKLLFEFNNLNGTVVGVGTRKSGNMPFSTVHYRCNDCGLTNEQMVRCIINGWFCKKCGQEKSRLSQTGRKQKISGLTKYSTIEDVQQFVDNCYGGERKFTVLYKFRKNKHTYIHVNCITCGIDFDKRLDNIQYKQNCMCSRRKTWLQALVELNKVNLTGKDVFDELTKRSFKGVGYPIMIFCNDCNQYYEILYYNYISNGARCGSCNYSYNEFYVQQYLQQYNIHFQREKTFKNCVHKSKLRFDFYVQKLNLIIETHGRQHYEKVDIWHKTQEDFEESQLRDSIKQQFIKDNGFNYLEIDCREFNSQTKIFNLLHSYIFSLGNLLKLNQCVIL